MSFKPCHLHRLDRQIWDILVGYLRNPSLMQLIKTGNRRVAYECSLAIRQLHIEGQPEDYAPLLCLTMRGNLVNLSIVDKMSETLSLESSLLLSRLVPQSRLSRLHIHTLSDATRLNLPPTMTDLSFGHCHESTTKMEFVVLGKARLVKFALKQIHISDQIVGPDTQCLYDKLYYNVIVPSAKTLVSLRFPRRVNETPLHLLCHTSLTELVIYCRHSEALKNITPPVHLESFGVMNTRSIVGLTEPKLFQMFGNRLKHLTLEFFGVLDSLDLSNFTNLESCTTSSRIGELTCAPRSKLLLDFSSQPHTLKNVGGGSVFLNCKSLWLHNSENDYDDFVLASLNWDSLEVLRISYMNGASPAFVRYSDLRLAKNVTRLNISYDNHPYFLARGGLAFFDMFRLQSVGWSITFSMLESLSSKGLPFPKNIKKLKLSCHDNDHPILYQSLGLLDWLLCPPKKLALIDIPFSPDVVAMCNHATQPLTLSFVWYGDTEYNDDDLSKFETFRPSPHVKKACFYFDCHMTNKMRTLLRHVFGSYYSASNILEASILYRAN